MKKSFLLLFCLSLLFWGFSSSMFAQQTSVGPNSKTFFLNPDQECTGTGELIYDDGTFENGYGWNAALVNVGMSAMLVTPPEYPWQFNTICIAFTQNATNYLDFDVVVYADDGAGGAPGTFVAEVTGLSATGIPAWPTLAWYEFDISSLPPLETGNWYIGIRWNNVPAYPGTFVGADETPNPPAQPGYGWSDYDGIWNNYSTWYPNYHALGMRTLGAIAGPPCPVTAPTDPNPPNGAVDVDVNIGNISWTNSAGTSGNEVWFGPQGGMVQVYDGAPITSWSVGTLEYLTDYQWKVRCKNDTCGTTSATWSFSTMQNPDLVTLFADDFESGLGNYTINTTGGCPWALIPISSRGYTLPPAAQGNALAADADLCGSGGGGSSGSITLNTPIDASMFQSVSVEWDNDWFPISTSDIGYLDVSTDGGTTWVNVVTFSASVRDTHEYYEISSLVGLHTFMLRLVSVQPGWDWWWAVDNLQVIGWDIVPVELSSFTASTSNGNVVLNWVTASETNNKGFEVQRSNGGEYQTIAFVQGNGTSTQQHSYTYSDQKVENGNYSYRLRQVDFNGTSEYSQVVEVSVSNPVEFSLAQNYPNPFNPSTSINYGLKVDSKVTLKVFDILGQEVVTLLNENIAAGSHNVTFDASRLNSGVYLYKIEAHGIDGSSFTSVKKMILTK